MSEMKLGGAAEMVMRECVTLDAVNEYGVKMLFLIQDRISMANELFWGNKIPTLWLAILDPLCSLIARRFDSRLLLQINSGRH
jgi:hypothetical protein